MNAQRIARVVLVYPVLFLLPALAWAQAESGNIAGAVRDASGAVMPGVTVEAASPALIEKVRVVTTDSQGLYRIVDLRPGTLHRYLYVARLWHGQARRYRVDDGVHGERECRVESRLARGDDHGHGRGPGRGHAERSSSSRRSRARSSMRSRRAGVPRSSSRSSSAPTAESNASTLHDVGGVGSDRAFFGVHGQRADDMTYNFGGMDSRVFSGGGFQYNAHTFEEVVVETAAGSAEATTGGVQINIIPKDGGNIFSGSISIEITGPKAAVRQS